VDSGDDWPLENVRVLNNLLIRNYVTADTLTRLTQRHVRHWDST
jgi:hypothetical protein